MTFLPATAIQAAHAALTFSLAERVAPECTVVLLTAPDEEHLIHLLFLAGYAGVANEGFWEPDLGNRLTAIALGTGARGLSRKYPLAFSQREEVR